MEMLRRTALVAAGLVSGLLGQDETSSWLAGCLARSADNAASIRKALAEVPGAQRGSMEFLVRYMPDEDLQTLSAEFLLGQVALAHATHAKVAWSRQVPDELFLNYVLPYAQANELREDWRSMLAERFGPVVAGCKTPGEVAQKLNETIFGDLVVRYSTTRRRPDQAPSESIEQGVASCTGLSILLADACRACSVPAGVVSVRWPHKAGNHSWVEVWDGQTWRFVGAAEPDPDGLDRAWFVGDAAHCEDAEPEHRIWAVSYAKTADRFLAGWGRDLEFWGEDVTARYAPQGQDAARAGAGDAALLAQMRRFFAADAAEQEAFEFDRNLDEELRTGQGDARLRALAFEAFCAHERQQLQADFEAKVARAGGKESPYTVKEVGEKPDGGWPLVIAMHGGGGVPKKFNDSQWRHMQIYYKDKPEVGGYLYVALRAPTDEWNGFYTDYFYPVIEKLIRQFVACGDVDPDRVIAIGYSHGGYGAFAVGPKLPHRFAAVHSSAAAPTSGQSSPVGLHSLDFSWMVGGKDNAYGRRERCESFAKEVDGLRAEHPGLYPCVFTLCEEHGHGGLPDRDLLGQLLPKERRATPLRLFWEPTDSVVDDHYWLHWPQPQKGQRLRAQLVDDGAGLQLELHGLEGVEAWLDARLCNLQGEFAIVSSGEARQLRPDPSLKTLCRTMQQRGDPALAATWIVELR
ncbi:MAG: transglutaminase domain-containing protein [Planctomycetota bacterium]|nr:transglutaminase domain-containing protein [Planctomycetota bacterium]